MSRPAYASSIYVSPNHTEANQAWDSILAGHGVVALQPSLVRELRLPEYGVVFDDTYKASGKHVFLIEAYHVMHCLASDSPYTILQITFSYDIIEMAAQPLLTSRTRYIST